MTCSIPHEYEDEVFQKSRMGIPIAPSPVAGRRAPGGGQLQRRPKLHPPDDEAEGRGRRRRLLRSQSGRSAAGALGQHQRSLAMLAKKAWRANDCASAIRAQAHRARIAMKQLQYESVINTSDSGPAGKLDDETEAGWNSEPPRNQSAAVPAPPPRPSLSGRRTVHWSSTSLGKLTS